jgi:nanoRNase/pAp phosphatase (c-di-AMP/oligoRNAs hydrolase)
MALASADPVEVGRRSTSASQRFLSNLSGFSEVVFLSHVHPDPDSLGSMFGLAHLIKQKLQLPTCLTQDGFIGRAENRAMVECLDLDLIPVESVVWSPRQAVVMVDSQPNTGRHTVPAEIPIHAVIDHHETPGDVEGVPFVDVRGGVGATCTLVTEYLADQDVNLPARVATGLFYGIDSELTGYPREASSLDDGAMQFLYPLVDKDRLAYIRNARLPHSYFETLLQGLQNSFIYDKLIMSWCGELTQPELVAEIADFLVRFEEIEWAYCSGVYQDQLVLSLRTVHSRGQAGGLLHKVVGRLGRAGGHDRRAGGSVPLTSTSPTAVEQLRSQLRKRLLEALDIDECRGQRLVSRKELLQSLGS